MAPVKRSRGVAEADGDIIEVQEARSNLRGESSNKRARTSLSATLEAAPMAESAHEADGPDRQSLPPQTQYERMRDAGFHHLEHTDYDDQQATQKIRNRPTRLGDNMVAESGIIESITCVNFMCHERLHVELGPLINFIVGENGSGKSAVLTALTLCLGGKASDTNRGGSLKSFVKEGCDNGCLVVRIKNAGSDAYQPEIYGNSIIVERHFSKLGSSGFKIKSEMGRIISTKKQEVDEISEWYSLQIGNPLTVLSQDNARQFLNSATPAQKYNYFVSGVQLEQLDNDYKMSQDSLDKTLLTREDLGLKIAEVERDMLEAQRLADAAKKNKQFRTKARLYRAQLIWFQVEEREQQAEQCAQEIEERERQIQQAMEELEAMTNALTSAEEKLTRAQAAKDELQQEGGTFQARTAHASEVFQTAKKELTDVHQDERDAHTRLKAITARINLCERKIGEEEKRLGESTGSARAEKDAELAAATEKAEKLEHEINESNQQVPVLQAKIADADLEAKRIGNAKENKRKDIVAAEQQLRELRKSTGGVYDGFDQEIINLVKEVAGDRGFQSKPIGPLGAHIKLLKPEWSGIIEKTLGDALNAFVVTSKADQSRLSGLMRRKNLKRAPPIYIAYGGHINTNEQEPANEFDTILRILKFDDDIIRSQLIINNRIEKIILVKDRVEAERIMVDNTPPRNVAACICFHDGRDKRGQGLRITNRNGTIGTTPIKPARQRPRMQSDTAQQLDLQEENLRQLGAEIRDITAEERLAGQTLQRCNTELAQLRREVKRLSDNLRRAQADVERISMDLDGFEGVDGRLNTLREELKAAHAEQEQTGAQYGTLKLNKLDLNAKAEKAKRALEAVKQEEADFKNRLTKANNKIDSSESIRRIAVSQKNTAHENLDAAKVEKSHAEEKRIKKLALVEEFVERANELNTERVHIPRDETYESIEMKYESVCEHLKARERRQGGSDRDIYDRAREAVKRHRDLVHQTKDIDSTIASLKRSIAHRLLLWRRFQRQISARVRIQFNYLLSERGFRGQIVLDHRSRKIYIQIEPDETKKSSMGRNTKTLSGGEKSFSSICMLLSVWEAIGSPIRCLDEFDVFMDNVNRAISTNMLVDTARRSVSRQYILITPNAIEGRAKLDKDVKVIRLTDPRQRTLV